MKDQRPDIRLGEDEARKVHLETAALLLRVLDELAFRHVDGKERSVCMDRLEEEVSRGLMSKDADSPTDIQTLK